MNKSFSIVTSLTDTLRLFLPQHYARPFSLLFKEMLENYSILSCLINGLKRKNNYLLSKANCTLVGFIFYGWHDSIGNQNTLLRVFDSFVKYRTYFWKHRTWNFCDAVSGVSGTQESVSLVRLDFIQIIVKSKTNPSNIGIKVLDMEWDHRRTISTPELFSWLSERRALGNPETKCLLIGFREEQSKASLIGAFMLARGVSRRRKVPIAGFWL